MLELKLNERNLRPLMGIMHDCLYVKSGSDIFRILELLNDVIPFNAVSLCRKGRKSGIIYLDKSINHSFPKEWVQYYTRNNLGRIDPIAIMSASTMEPFTWENAYSDIELTDELKEFICLAESHGMKSGITCSCSTGKSNDIDTILSFETSGCKVGEEYLSIVGYILPHLHEAIYSLDKVVDVTKDFPNFTAREKETLKWVYQGKTAWEIGMILSVSERTVKFHLKNIYQKLNVTNRAQAVAKALRYEVV